MDQGNLSYSFFIQFVLEMCFLWRGCFQCFRTPSPNSLLCRTWKPNSHIFITRIASFVVPFTFFRCVKRCGGHLALKANAFTVKDYFSRFLTKTAHYSSIRLWVSLNYVHPLPHMLKVKWHEKLLNKMQTGDNFVRCKFSTQSTCQFKGETNCCGVDNILVKESPKYQLKVWIPLI